MAEKVTIMVLKVDLDCTKCYKKIKKLLCKYDQIRNQVYDEKANTVTITVVCCSPENFRDKLCCKGRGTIKSIDIKEPEKKEEPKKKEVSEKKEEAKKKEEPEKKEEPKKKEEPAGTKSEQENKKKELVQVPVAGYPLPYPTYGACFVPCYVSRPGGPCNCGCGHGMSMPAAPPCNCGCGGRSVCYDGGYGRGCTVTRCEYIIEENPSGCTIM